MQVIKVQYLLFLVVCLFTTCMYTDRNSNIMERERKTGSKLSINNCKILDNYYNTLLVECGDKEWWLDSLFVVIIEENNTIGEPNLVYYGLEGVFYGSGIYNDTIIYIFNDTLVRFLNVKRNGNFEVIYDVYVDSILSLDTLLFSIEPPYNIRFRDSILSIYSLDLNFGDVYLCILQNFNFSNKFKIKKCDEFSIGVNNYFFKLYPDKFLIYMRNGDTVKNVNILSMSEFHKDNIVAINTKLNSYYMVTQYRVFWDNWIVIYDLYKSKIYASNVICNNLLICHNTIICGTKGNTLKLTIRNDILLPEHVGGSVFDNFSCPK